MSFKKSLLSLRNVLIVPYVTLVILLATTLGFLSYDTGSEAVHLVSTHLLTETASRISQAVDRHVVGSVATLTAAFPEGMTAPTSIESDFDNLKTRFWIATSLHTDPNNYVYYGTTSGQAFGLFRLTDNSAQLRIKYRPENQRDFYLLEGLNGEPVFQKREMKLFDPRARPWFQAARNSQKDIWTSVYIDFSTKDLVATRARRVKDKEGNLKGVVATDMPLRSLNEFVSNLDVSPNGIAFIIEPTGDLIASSVSPNVRRNEEGFTVRINAAESDNAMLVEAYREVRSRLTATDAVPTEPFFYTDSQGEKIHIACSRFKDEAGLTWINVVAIPDRDFTGGISENVRRTILLAAFATLLVILVGLGILHWVSRDLKKLSFAVNQVASGTCEKPLTIRRNDEIGALADSFEAMQQRLRTDYLTGLPNRYALEQALHDVAGNEEFALLFIDMNGFKRINDQYGHDTGDQALIILAQRLRQQLRKQDMIARYAGDEFVVLLRGETSASNLEPIRHKIDQALSDPLLLDGKTIPLHGGAVGVAFSPADGINPGALLVEADKRMYWHKDQLQGKDYPR